MASVANDPKGRKRVLFVGADGKRRPIRLGKATKAQAATFREKVEKLVSAAVLKQAPDPETAAWVAGLDDVMHARLSAVGLATARGKRDATALGGWIDGYIDRKSVELKPGTKIALQQTRKDLVGFFGETKDIREITEGDADEWRLHLIGRELANNTIRRRCGRAKQFFRAAARKGLIDANPFADLPSAVKENPDREYFLSVADARKVLDACPDAEWRLIFALSRYGGLRCPSEHLLLKWADVDWAAGRFTVHSPKTERHEGKESRDVPIFPELLPYLREAFEQAEPGAEFVIAAHRTTGMNLRTNLQRIIRKAGVAPWPKLFQNLRATRQTELTELFPAHVVCAWIGNSEIVAKKHYLQVTNDHFARGAGMAAQKAAQQVAETTGIDRNTPTP